MDKQTLLELCLWIDEEYRLCCMVPVTNCDSREFQILHGYMAALADMKSCFRSWAETGKAPQHRPVRSDWRWAFENKVKNEKY